VKLIFLYFLSLLLVISCGEELLNPIDYDAPTDLYLSRISGTILKATWKDNSSHESGFVLQRRTGNETFSIIANIESNTKAFIDTDLDENRVYYYRIAAVIENSYTEWSNVKAIQTYSTISDMTFGEDSTLEVMTWNIQHFPKNEDTTVNYVAEAVKALQIDIIAMQEMGTESNFNELCQKINEIDEDNNWIGEWRYSDIYGNNLAIIYNSKSLNNVEFYEIFDSQNDWFSFPRAPLVIEADFAGKHFYVINNHLKAMPDSESEERRRQACLRLDQYIEDFLVDENVIILGDLNDVLTDTEECNVFWNFLEDSNNYLFADMEIALGSDEFWSYQPDPYLSHLDHMLITNELFDEFSAYGSVVSTILIDRFMDGGFNDYDTNISDHRPVALKLVLD
jgi:endonuclease/exonuclease/phosphatase family metal-dependent hydrolase